MTERITFEAWCAELDKLRYPWSTTPITQLTGTECWEGYYDLGYCPEDALAEDLTHAD